jgi:hypothetical protein
MNKAFFYKAIGFSIIVIVIEVIGLQIAIIYQTGSKVFSTFKTAELPAAFILEISTFVGIALVLHALVLAYAWLSAYASLVTLRIQHQAAENIGLMVLAISWAAIFLLNNAFISRSIFAYWGEFSLGPLNQTSCAFLVTAIALSPLVLIAWWAIKSVGKRTAMALTAGIALCTLLIGPAIQAKSTRASVNEPNVIVIGIDSFRPEYLHSRDIMPQMSTVLADAAVFPQVYTPLARTFPSWTSMLSGLHPVETGARINLMDPELVRRDTMMTCQLREAG